MKEVMEQRLAAKKREIERKQEYFLAEIKDINSDYEGNAIGALLDMQKLKTEIHELEFLLQLVAI